MKIFIGTLEDVFGYGISVASKTHEECYNTMFEKYKSMYKQYSDVTPTTKNFEQSMEARGGSIREVKLNHPYYDGFQY